MSDTHDDTVHKAEPVEASHDENGRLTKDGKRRLSQAFVAYIGKPGNPFKPGHAQKRKKPLTDALVELVEEHPELARMMALRLMRTALLGRGRDAIAASKLIFERVDGLVVAEKSSELPSVSVTLQNFQHTGGREEPRTVTATADLPRGSREIPIGPEGEPDKAQVARIIRRDVRKLPQPTDVLGPLEADEDG